jgi:hypothetical protein
MTPTVVQQSPSPLRHGASSLLRGTPVGLVFLLALYLLGICVSLATVGYVLPDHHFGIGWEHLLRAIVATLLAASLIPLFVLARFNFGYLIGLNFYGMIAGFIWISYFTDLSYDHAQARLSAFASLVMFLLPALFVSIPLKRKIVVSLDTMDRLLTLMLVFALLVILWDAFFGFAFVSPKEAAELRESLARPAVLRYLNGILVVSVLPFAFAYFGLRRRYYRAGISIFLMLLFYPVLLTRTVLFAPVWLVFSLLMFRTLEARVATILVSIVPLTLGLAIYAVASSFQAAQGVAIYVLELVNLRMFAVPSSALDHYLEFFATNPVTHLCQISFVRAIASCPYAGDLSIIFSERYHLGNLNASLFATEGIASVGPMWAPLSAFFCGLLLSVGNGVSARLPVPLIAVSSGLIVQTLLNVPLSITLLSNGLLILFLLWYITPTDPELVLCEAGRPL